jgi:hypothetical protein
MRSRSQAANFLDICRKAPFLQPGTALAPTEQFYEKLFFYNIVVLGLDRALNQRPTSESGASLQRIGETALATHNSKAFREFLHYGRHRRAATREVDGMSIPDQAAPRDEIGEVAMQAMPLFLRYPAKVAKPRLTIGGMKYQSVQAPIPGLPERFSGQVGFWLHTSGWRRQDFWKADRHIG